MIYVDDRVGSKELVDHIPSSTPTSLTKLQSGDFSWLGNGPGGPASVGVERKRIGDLVNSIDNNRLSGQQLLVMQRAYDRIYLIVEGVWRPDPNTGILQTLAYGKWQDVSHGSRKWMARGVWNYLNRLAVMLGVVVWPTSSIAETGQWLSATYHWWQKEWGDHKLHDFYSHCQPTTVQLFRPGLVPRVAKELGGVGWDRATALGNRFDNVLELVMASEKELQEVEGIGKKLAKSIKEELMGQKEV